MPVIAWNMDNMLLQSQYQANVADTVEIILAYSGHFQQLLKVTHPARSSEGGKVDTEHRM